MIDTTESENEFDWTSAETLKRCKTLSACSFPFHPLPQEGLLKSEQNPPVVPHQATVCLHTHRHRDIRTERDRDIERKRMGGKRRKKGGETRTTTTTTSTTTTTTTTRGRRRKSKSAGKKPLWAVEGRTPLKTPVACADTISPGRKGKSGQHSSEGSATGSLSFSYSASHAPDTCSNSSASSSSASSSSSSASSLGSVFSSSISIDAAEGSDESEGMDLRVDVGSTRQRMDEPGPSRIGGGEEEVEGGRKERGRRRKGKGKGKKKKRRGKKIRSEEEEEGREVFATPAATTPFMSPMLDVEPVVSLTRLADGTARPMAGEFPVFSAAEVALNASAGACWLTANGNVYDVTSFLTSHPAGPQCILKRAGGDATQDFQFHLSKGKAMWRRFQIGVLDTKKSNCAIM